MSRTLRACMWAALLAGCQSSAGATSTHSEEMQAAQPASFGTPSDLARDASEVRTQLAFGPIAKTALKSPLRIVITEQEDGSADETLRYEARTERYLLVFGLDYARLQKARLVIGGDALTDVELQ